MHWHVVSMYGRSSQGLCVHDTDLEKGVICHDVLDTTTLRAEVSSVACGTQIGWTDNPDQQATQPVRRRSSPSHERAVEVVVSSAHSADRDVWPEIPYQKVGNWPQVSCQD